MAESRPLEIRQADQSGRDKKRERGFLDAWLRQVGASTVIDAIGDALTETPFFVVDAEQHIVYWSAAAERQLGFAAREVLGENCRKANRCHQCNMGCGVKDHAIIDGQPLTLYSAEGEPLQFLKTARSFVDEDGSFLGGIEFLIPDSHGDPEAAATEGGAVWSAPESVDFHGLQTRDQQMLQVFQTIRNVAETDATVLVRGDSGTGKELVARAVHLESQRSAGPFVAVNCAALTPTLLESELFGHVKGAFTGAVRDRLGLFRQADGGTLFLDEVAELPLELQAKLLRVIQEREVTPVGGTDKQPVDVRLVAATHRSLRREVGAGRFREDLMFRLRVVPLFVPRLAQRIGDVELLLWSFIAQLNSRGPRRIDRIHPRAMRAILDYQWPGNVRELRNVIEYAFAVGRGTELLLEELPPEFREEKATSPDQEDEAAAVRRALMSANGDLTRAAEVLGVSRATLWRKRKKYGL